MYYALGFLALIYGFSFYKSIMNLRSFRAGSPKILPLDERTEFRAETDRLTEGLGLDFLGEFREDKPVIDHGYPHHHLAYHSPDRPLILWFFLTEQEAEQRVAVLSYDSDFELTEIPQDRKAWKEVWEEQHDQATALDFERINSERLATAVTQYLEVRAAPLIQAYGKSCGNGLRRLSWPQSISIFLKMLGKGKVGITCDEKGKLCVVPRKNDSKPDLDQIGHLIQDLNLMALLDIKHRETKKIVERRKKKSQWLLPASLVAFLVSFFGIFDWETVLILAAVIFIHELGHWAAMKFFGYEDTSFLFLPFFGGVAMGRKKSPKLHESVLVFLAGPVPGVLLAMVLALYWPAPRNVILNQFIIMLWIINLINLLPIIPLDGGRIVAATLFSKTPRAEFVFRLLTGLGLLGFFLKSDDYILLMLGVIVLTNTVPTKKVADICDHYRKSKTEPTDLEVARKTYEEFQFDPNKHIQLLRAVRLDQVFQRMESDGASWPAALFWLLVYVVCLVGSGGLGMTRILG